MHTKAKGQVIRFLQESADCHSSSPCCVCVRLCTQDDLTVLALLLTTMVSTSKWGVRRWGEGEGGVNIKSLSRVAG